MKMKPMVMTCLLILAGSGPSLWAERVNTVSGSVNVVAGLDDNPRVSGLQFADTAQGYKSNWGLYPSLQLDSRGARSLFNLNYAFGLNRMDTDLDLDSESHSVGLGWRYDGAKWTFSLTEQLRKSPDFAAFNQFQGIVFTPEGVFFDYEAVALRRDSYQNNASLQIDRRIGPRSSLTFGVGHSLRNFEAAPQFQRRLSDQNQFSGNFGWDRQLTSRTSLNTRYQFTHFDFDAGVYPDARSHDINLGFTVQVNPTVRFNLSAGPSYTEQIGSDLSYWGYNAQVGVSKNFEKRFVSAYYSRRNGASVGIGALSRTQRLGFGFGQELARRLTADFGVSLYDTQRVFTNTVDLRGLQGSLILNLEMHRRVFLSVGASYTSQEEDSDFPELNLSGINDLDRRRFWVSIRFDAPEFWRF